jgi:16S rRNA (guanine1516-N2)-methyltransferase
MVSIAISADRGIPKTQLDQLAKQTSLPLLDQHTQADYLLHINTEHLELRKIDSNHKKTKFESIYVDFLAGKTNHRRLHGGGKGQDLAKAIGLHKINNPTVLDLTAGMGGDAFVLATLGATITLLERNPITHALLNDALYRAKLSADDELQGIIARMTLKNEDAHITLEKLSEENISKEILNEDSLSKGILPDVIYIDPMFPSRSKSALVKKEMQFFHDIVGDDKDSEKLLLKSLALAKKRIVVKRPRLAEKLTETIQPAFDISGKSTRYDVYLPKNPD